MYATFKRRIFIQLTTVHQAMGMFAMGMFVAAHANLIIFVSSPTPKPPSAASLVAHVPFLKDGIVALPPSILEELYTLGPEAVKTVADGLHEIIFAGAPLQRAVGDALIAAGLKFVAGYGAYVCQNSNPFHTDLHKSCPQEPSSDLRQSYTCNRQKIGNMSNFAKDMTGNLFLWTITRT